MIAVVFFHQSNTCFEKFAPKYCIMYNNLQFCSLIRFLEHTKVIYFIEISNLEYVLVLRINKKSYLMSSKINLIINECICIVTVIG